MNQEHQLLERSVWAQMFTEFLLKFVSNGSSLRFPSLFIRDKIQSTLVISNSKGLSEILRDIRTSTYQICRIGEKLI